MKVQVKIDRELVKADVLVIGGGIAGCFAAIKAKEAGADVVLVDKGSVGKAGQSPHTNTFAAFDPNRHDIDSWLNVCNTTGDYMNDRDWSKIVYTESTDRWADWVEWGAYVYHWNHNGEPYECVAKEPSNDPMVVMPLNPKGMGTIQFQQSYRHPPRKNILVLRNQCLKVGVRVMDRITILDLLKQDDQVVGATGISPDSDKLFVFQAKSVILCSGPAGLKSPGLRCMSTGDADAMAYRVGCTITGKEWEETHPVRCDFPAWPWAVKDRDRLRTFAGEIKPNTPTLDCEEHVTGMHWSRLATHHLEAFMAYEGVTPAIWQTCTGMSEFSNMHLSPKGYPRSEYDERLAKSGRIRMVMGRALGQSSHVSDGLWPINKDCESEVPGLYAAGDCLGARACGAEYPGQGFAAAYCSVTGARAGAAAARRAAGMADVPLRDETVDRSSEYIFAPYERNGGFGPAWVTQLMQSMIFPYYVIFVKSEERLQLALQQILYVRKELIPKLYANDFHELRLVHETINMALNMEMKLRASLERKESRGAHFREDYPKRDDPYGLMWIKIKDVDGAMTLSQEKIPEKWWPDFSIPYEERYRRRFPLHIDGHQVEGIEDKA
ncbi:MAG: FAD-binding protein [Oscillospiraceae bacterium]|nr:FAD-binding protein [Oscillospiraceae bacterium]